ncbi:MAG: hypothetical protein HXX13_07000, partial [Bacteroidetes bacterium]|nr:hypothetical protein [Bacteroidota bacterium]
MWKKHILLRSVNQNVLPEMSYRNILLCFPLVTLLILNSYPVSGQEKMSSKPPFSHNFQVSGNKEVFSIDLTQLDSPFALMTFYNLAYEQKIYCVDKNELKTETAQFYADNRDTLALQVMMTRFLFESNKKNRETKSELEVIPPSRARNLANDAPMGTSPTCEDAQVFCGSAAYGFTAGTNNGSGQSGPYYGCLGSTPNPAWYFMQIGPPGGNIVINMWSSPSHDIDFICWGPFTSPTGACTAGLTQSAVVDCSYSGASTETCTIPNAIVGQFYMLMITNFSNQNCEITFSQTNYGDPGAGTTNCNIVVNCSVLSLSPVATACDPATNTFSISGEVEFTNPPATGVLKVIDNTANPPVSQSFSAPFNSPQPFSFTNITCDGIQHDIQAFFTDNGTCSLSQHLEAPNSICPIATISGGGIICNDGTTTANVSIDVIGVGPFNIYYSHDGVPQTPLLGYNGIFPYIISTNAAGNYTLDSIRNGACLGTVSGVATITLNTVPVPTVTGNNLVCAGSTGNVYTTQSGSGYHNYQWVVSPGGTITAGGGVNDPTATVTWTTAGTKTVSVNYSGPGPTNCTAASPALINLTVDPYPLVNAGPDADMCQVNTYTLNGTTSNTDLSTLSWSENGPGSITGGNSLNPVYTPLPGESGNVNFTVTVNGTGACTSQQVQDVMILTVNPPPHVVAGPDATICAGSTYSLVNSMANFCQGLHWTSTGTGSFDNSSILHPVYTPSAADVSAGSVFLILKGDGALSCNALQSIDTLLVTIQPQSTAFPGATATICEGSTYTLSASTASNYTSLAWTTSGSGSFDNASSLHPTYTPGLSDITSGTVVLTLTATGVLPCGANNAPMTLHITRQPLANAGSNATICQTGTYTLSSATAQYYTSLHWTHTGTGSFNNDTLISPTYTPGPGENGTITLTLHALAASPCTDATSGIQLGIQPVAVVSAGPNDTICEGSTYSLLGSSVSNAISVLWSRSGSGTFNIPGNLHPVYTPSAADIAAGSVTLTLTATANAPCPAESSSMTLHITRQPISSAGPNATICQSGSYTLSSATAQYYTSINWTHNGTGSFNDPTLVNPTYTPGPGESGIVTLTIHAIAGYPCTNAVQSMLLTVQPVATAAAGPNAVICEGSSYTLAGSSVTNTVSLLWSRSGTGSFNNPTTLHPVYTPSAADIAAGFVNLTLTASANAPCPAVVSSLRLDITRQCTAWAGSDASICQNGTYTLSSATAQFASSVSWTHTGTGTFNDATLVNPTYTPGPGESGTITLTLHSNPIAPCSGVTDDMFLTINPLPVADAGPDDVICQGNNVVINGATALNTTAGGISWTENGPGTLMNANTITPTYVPVPGETGTVTLRLTVNGAFSCSGQTATDTRLLTYTPVPDVVAGSNTTICAANTLTLAGIANNCNTVAWTSSGDGSFSNPGLLNAVYTPGPNDILTGSVILTLTGNGSSACSALNDIDQFTLTIDPMPKVDAGPDDAFCVSNSVPVNGATASNFSSISWSAGDGTFNNANILGPVYTPGVIDLNTGLVTLTLSATGRLSCASRTVTDTRVFSVSKYPMVNAGNDNYICSNTTQYQLSGIGNNFNLGTIQWTVSGGDGTLSNPNVLNPIYFAGPIDLSTVNRTVTFTLKLQGTGNCSGIFVSDDVILQIDPTPVSNAGPDGEICGRRQFPMNATAQFQSLITWSTSGDGTFSNPNILNPTYTPGPNDVGNNVFLTLGLAGCQSLTGNDFMMLTVRPDPTATISGTTHICEATSAPISISFTGTPPWSVTYTNGSSAVTVNNILSSPYSFTVTPPVTSSYWVTSAHDSYCNVPNDSIFGLASVTIDPLPDPYTTTTTSGGVFCEGTAGVAIGLSGSQPGMSYE